MRIEINDIEVKTLSGERIQINKQIINPDEFGGLAGDLTSSFFIPFCSQNQLAVRSGIKGEQTYEASQRGRYKIIIWVDGVIELYGRAEFEDVDGGWNCNAYGALSWLKKELGKEDLSDYHSEDTIAAAPYSLADITNQIYWVNAFGMGNSGFVYMDLNATQQKNVFLPAIPYGWSQQYLLEKIVSESGMSITYDFDDNFWYGKTVLGKWPLQHRRASIDTLIGYYFEPTFPDSNSWQTDGFGRYSYLFGSSGASAHLVNYNTFQTGPKWHNYGTFNIASEELNYNDEGHHPVNANPYGYMSMESHKLRVTIQCFLDGTDIGDHDEKYNLHINKIRLPYREEGSWITPKCEIIKSFGFEGSGNQIFCNVLNEEIELGEEEFLYWYVVKLNVANPVVTSIDSFTIQITPPNSGFSLWYNDEYYINDLMPDISKYDLLKKILVSNGLYCYFDGDEMIVKRYQDVVTNALTPIDITNKINITSVKLSYQAAFAKSNKLVFENRDLVTLPDDEEFTIVDLRLTDELEIQIPGADKLFNGLECKVLVYNNDAGIDSPFDYMFLEVQSPELDTRITTGKDDPEPAATTQQISAPVNEDSSDLSNIFNVYYGSYIKMFQNYQNLVLAARLPASLRKKILREQVVYVNFSTKWGIINGYYFCYRQVFSDGDLTTLSLIRINGVTSSEGESPEPWQWEQPIQSIEWENNEEIETEE